MMSDWLTLAQELPLNGKTDTECPEQCGSGTKLSVNHDQKSYWCYCYRCGFSQSEYKGKQTLAELAEINRLNDEARELKLKVELPEDFSYDIPIAGRLWLYKAGISESRWREYRIGYSRTLRRVILPVYNANGDLIWFQGRAVFKGQTPKYLQPAADRSTILFRGYDSSKPATKNPNGQLILVEDILSAIRVGKHCDTISLLGTKITSKQANVLSSYEKVFTWLDSDRAGQRGSYKIRQTLGLVTEVGNIITEKDPKELSDKQILEVLEKCT